MTHEQRARYDMALFAIGLVAGALADESVRTALADAIRADRLPRTYIQRLADQLVEVLEEAVTMAETL